MVRVTTPKEVDLAGRVVRELHERLMTDPGEVGALALVEAWKKLVGAPPRIAKMLSVTAMARQLAEAAQSIQSVYAICGGDLPLPARDIGQRTIGRFEVMRDGTYSRHTVEWSPHESRWTTQGQCSPDISGATLDELCATLEEYDDNERKREAARIQKAERSC